MPDQAARWPVRLMRPSQGRARPAVLFLMLAGALLAAACGGGSTPAASPSPTATALETATPSPTPAPSPTATPDPGGTRVPSTVQLVEAASGRAVTLFASDGLAAFDAWFEGDEALIRAGAFNSQAVTQRFDLQGALVEESADSGQCRTVEGSAVVAGRTYPGVSCGSISPDGRWMTYQVEPGGVALPSGYSFPKWDQWLVDLASGETRELQAGLVHCGGCDWFWGVSWSPNSRYLAFAELAGDERSFLADVRSGPARPLGHGVARGDRPSWTPDGNRIVYRAEAHPATLARLEDLATGARIDLAIPWPVAFDPSGTYLYSPSWAYDPKGAGVQTVIVDAATGRNIATLAGVPRFAGIDLQPRVVGRSSAGYVVALQDARGCDGTVIYREAVAEPLCIEGGEAAVVAADGGLVAVARKVGVIGPAHGPNFETDEINVYEVDIVDSASGKRMTAVRGAASFIPPAMIWDDAGTHLLVLWPRWPGL